MSGAFSILFRFIFLPFLGWLAAKSGLAGERFKQGTGFALMNFFYPFLIFANTWQTDFHALWAQSAFTALFCVCLTGLLFVGGQAFFRRRVEEPALWNFMLGITNAAYIGIPVLDMFFDSSALTLGLVYNAVGDLFIWLLYYPLILAGNKRPLGRILCNPCLLALVLGLGLSLGGVTAPETLRPWLGRSTALVSAVALFYVGLVLSEARLKEMFSASCSWMFSLIKVVLIPTVCFFVLLPLTGAEQAAILSILAGCPAPLLSLVWSRDKPTVQRQAVNTVVISTLLFLAVVIPLCMLFT